MGKDKITYISCLHILKDNEGNKVINFYRWVEWKGKKRLACRNGLLLEVDLIEGLVLYPTGLGNNRVSGRPNRVSLYADMMRISDPARQQDQASSHKPICHPDLFRCITCGTWHTCAEAR